MESGRLQSFSDSAFCVPFVSCVVSQREKAAMPWTTLVLLEGGAQYVKHRLARALQLWARYALPYPPPTLSSARVDSWIGFCVLGIPPLIDRCV
jgi:hypothetical protein